MSTEGQSPKNKPHIKETKYAKLFYDGANRKTIGYVLLNDPIKNYF